MSNSGAVASVGRASALLASGTIVSRALGFISAAVLAHTLGTQNAAANAFTIANQLPNNVYAIIAGGLLSAILVPQIVRASQHDDGGEKFINRIVTIAVVAFLAIAIIATACAPFLVHLYAHQENGSGRGLTGAQIALATAFAYWCLPQIFFYGLYSLFGEVLNARRVFGPFTWAPVINNVVAIGGLVTFSVAFGTRPLVDATAWSSGMIALIAGSATLGVFAQAFFLVFFWRRAGLRYRPEFRWRGVGLGRVGKAAGWTFGMILITQLAGIVQSDVATLAGTGNASNTVLRNAWLIFMLPHGIVTVSIATAYFTRMSGHAHRGDLLALRGDLTKSLRTIGLVLVFAAVALIVVAYPFAAVFSKHGFAETQAMGNVVIAYLVGLVPFSVLFVLQRTFYALEDTRTPFFFQGLQSILFVTGALLVSTFPRDRIAVGIAIVTTVAGIVQTAVAAVLLRRRIGGLGTTEVARSYLVFLAALIPAAAAGVGLDVALGAFRGGVAVSGVAGGLASVALIAAVMAVAYIAALAVLRSRELREISAPLMRRIRPRR